MSLTVKLTELFLGVIKGKVTISYPYIECEAPTRYRGRPIFDANKCIGCGGCASNCPTRAILVSDPCQEIRIIQYVGKRCAYCGRCVEVCPEGAISLSKDFEITTSQVKDLNQRMELFMSSCQRCGRCFQPPSPLEALKLKGYRYDDITHESWVFKSSSYLQPLSLENEADLDRGR